MLSFMWGLFELVATVYESFVICHFIFGAFSYKFKLSKNRLRYIVSCILTAAIITFMNCFTIYEGVLGVVYIVFYFVLELIFIDGSFLKKLFVSIAANIVLISVNALVSGVMSALFKNELSVVYTEQSISRFLMIITVQLLLTLVFGILTRLFSGSVSLNAKEWTLVLSVLCASFISLAFIHIYQLNAAASEKGDILLLISEIGIIVINVICFYMTVSLNKSNRKSMELETQNQRQEYRIKYAENVRNQYEETRKIRHDMRQSLSVIERLYADGKYQEAHNFTEKCTEKLSEFVDIIDVGNDFVNAILNSKIILAKSKGIVIICSASKSVLGVDNADLCNILGNMLDNAIEACEKCNADKKSIDCKIFNDESKIILTVSNEIAVSELENNPTLQSTKTDTKLHGFGVKSIKQVAEKYGGSADFYEEQSRFICKVLLYK